jgi:ribonuclease HI
LRRRTYGREGAVSLQYGLRRTAPPLFRRQKRGEEDHVAQQELIIYTDGGCSGNPGAGGWAFVMVDENRRRERSGGEKMTTNNRMELTAVIEALDTVRRDESLRGRPVRIFTDSQYVKNGITAWIHNWERNGWMTSAKKPVKNREYWRRLKELADSMDVKWTWVKGHAGDELNEACDAMVQEEIKKHK